MLDKLKSEGFYQTLEMPDKTYKGWRECKNRWKTIEPYINKNSVVMDIGSNYGYFSKKIVDKFEDNLVWSFESNLKRAEIQKEMLEANKIKNVVLSHYELELLDFLKIARSSEAIDLILTLSVIHYFKKEEIPYIIWLFSQIAPVLIIEVPNHLEEKVAEKDNVVALKNIERYLGHFYQNVDKIGESPSPKNLKIKRSIFRAENLTLKRENVTGYINGEMGRTHTLKYKDRKWSLDNKKNWLTGLNVYNLKLFNMIYPSFDSFLLRAGERYWNLMKQNKVPTDTRIWNCLKTPFDIEVIDYQEEPDYLNLEEYKKEIKNYSPLDFTKKIIEMSK